MPVTESPSPNTTGLAVAREGLRDMKATLVTTMLLLVAVGITLGAGLAWYSPSTGPQLAVGVSDYRISMPTTLRAGHLTIGLTNNGAQAHELLIFRTDLQADALPVDTSGDVIEDSPKLDNVLDSGAGLKARGTQALAVTLQPGHYVAVCNLPAHYRLGMRLDITVTN